MVVVVPLRTPYKGQMIAGVGRASVVDDEREPHHGRHNVALHDANPNQRWDHVAEDMLHRMSIQRCPSYRSRELVVLFVDHLVQTLVVQQPVTVVEANLPADPVDEHVADYHQRRRQHPDVRKPVPGKQVKQRIGQG